MKSGGLRCSALGFRTAVGRMTAQRDEQTLAAELARPRDLEAATGLCEEMRGFAPPTSHLLSNVLCTQIPNPKFATLARAALLGTVSLRQPRGSYTFDDSEISP